MWISPADNEQCTSLHQDGSLTSYPNLFSDNSTCEEYTRVLCASTIKEPIIGRQYMSYFSNQYISDHRELFRRIVDTDRSPIQLGGTLTVFQEDSWKEDDDGNFTLIEFTVTDELPTALSVVVNLTSSVQEDVQVALDSFDETSYTQPHKWDFYASSKMPSKIQIHTNGSVCVSIVQLLFQNQTGTDHLVIQIPATMFEGCHLLNVCDGNDLRLCGRSLMYFDKSQGCAVLKTNNAIYPRDLSLNIFDGGCSRLTSWNHPSLGEPFMINLDWDFNATEDISLKELSSDRNKYIFEPKSITTSQLLDENNWLPTVFSLQGGSGGLVKSVGAFVSCCLKLVPIRLICFIPISSR